LKGSHLLPNEAFGAGTSISQLGQISLVAVSIYAAIWFKTCPLYGIDRGRITSKAEIRLEASITNSSFSMV